MGYYSIWIGWRRSCYDVHGNTEWIMTSAFIQVAVSSNCQSGTEVIGIRSVQGQCPSRQQRTAKLPPFSGGLAVLFFRLPLILRSRSYSALTRGDDLCWLNYIYAGGGTE